MTPRRRPPSVGIIGGGTAGYLAALAFRTRRPDVEVTLVESSRIPIIGVGEGTTPLMVPFLHGFLGIDPCSLFEAVRPTWKLGVRLEWGLPGDYFFQFPFDAHAVADSFRHTGDINSSSMGALIMKEKRGLHLQRGDWSYQSLLPALPYAYHLDNRRFAGFLKAEAARRGVQPVDALIVGLPRAERGGVARAVADDGRSFEFDLYVDCSGFSSRLLGQTLDTPFIDYGASLFTDTALIGSHDHHDAFGPYTTATTMDAGWCWSLPQLENDHRGYVFSSRFLSDDQAADEMRRKCPGLGELHRVKFRSGRHADWWRHNVVALGNAYGFVEPLEATALHMVVREISYLVHHLDDALDDPKHRERLNESVGVLWDNLAGLLALHYRFNRRLDTPFWRAARAETSLGAIADLVDDVLERGPAPAPMHDPSTGTLLGGLTDEIDLLLLGMQAFEPEKVEASQPEAEWRRYHRTLEDWARRAVSPRDSFELALSDPSIADPSGGRWYEGVLSGLRTPVGGHTTPLDRRRLLRPGSSAATDG